MSTQNNSIQIQIFRNNFDKLEHLVSTQNDEEIRKELLENLQNIQLKIEKIDVHIVYLPSQNNGKFVCLIEVSSSSVTQKLEYMSKGEEYTKVLESCIKKTIFGLRKHKNKLVDRKKAQENL